jgi:hypothetical protein
VLLKPMMPNARAESILPGAELGRRLIDISTILWDCFRESEASF